jgi:hypothetical protein
MGMIHKTLNFLGWGAHREIVDKTLGKPLKQDRLKPLISDIWTTFYWACTVIGDKCFPSLKGKQFLKIHLAGVIVLVVASIIPSLLIVRAGKRLTDFEWVNIRREQAMEKRGQDQTPTTTQDTSQTPNQTFNQIISQEGDSNAPNTE